MALGLSRIQLRNELSFGSTREELEAELFSVTPTNPKELTGMVINALTDKIIDAISANNECIEKQLKAAGLLNQ